MSEPKPVFFMPPDWKLRDPAFYRDHIWRPARAKRISRVAWLDALTLIFRHEGRIFLQSGKPFPVPEIDEVFTDPQNRWMSGFLEADGTGDAPKRQCRTLPKLRLIALYCDITTEGVDDLCGAD